MSESEPTSMIEALFTYLIANDRIPLDLGIPVQSASSADASSSRWNPPPLKRLRRNEEPSLPQVRSVLNRVRGEASDDDLWEAWRFFTREVGTFVWLTGMVEHPHLNGARGFIASFDARAARIGVKVTAGETLLLPGRNLAWCPPVIDVGVVAAVLAKALDPETARRVCTEISCKRCSLPCDIGGRCQMPHPETQRMRLVDEECDEDWSNITVTRNDLYLCEACGGQFWKREDPLFSAPGPGNCWEGMHTTALLPWLDKRRLDRHEDCEDCPYKYSEHYNEGHTSGHCGCNLTLSGPLLQVEIQDLSVENFEWFKMDFVKMSDIVTYLGISEDTGGVIRNLMDDGAEGICLDVALFNLEELRITDSTLGSVLVKLNVFPVLEKLVSFCPRTFCTTSSSSLKSLHVFSWRGLENDIEDMLKGMPSLEELQICRFTGRELVISSKSLRHLGISPVADRRLKLISLGISPLPVRRLQLWTPKLMVLDLAHRGDLDESRVLHELIWLKNHPRGGDVPGVPDGHVPPPLFVRVLFSNNMQSSAVKYGLRAHPDVTYYSKVRAMPTPKRRPSWQ